MQHDQPSAARRFLSSRKNQLNAAKALIVALIGSLLGTEIWVMFAAILGADLFLASITWMLDKQDDEHDGRQE